MAEVTGKVVQILGGVVDCEFPPGELPQVYDAIELDRPGQAPLVLEVQRHLGDRQVRTVAMDTTDGLQRGMPARSVGGPITVPVGEASLGRVFNVLGVPVDGRGEVKASMRYPTPPPAPPSKSSHGGWRFSRPG